MYSLTETINWLLKGEPYIEYRTRIDLLGENEDDPKVSAAKKKMSEDPKIQQLIAELKNWPGTVLNSHKSASQPFHKLSFIADIGLTKNDSGISLVAKKIFEHQSDEGPFQLPTNVPKHFGGSGQDSWAWALCDAPTVIYALAKFGYNNETLCEESDKVSGQFSLRKRLALHGFQRTRQIPWTRQKRRPVPICHACDAKDAITI